MGSIETKFENLATDNAPGQETRRKDGAIEALLRGDRIAGTPVDFSHVTPGAEFGPHSTDSVRLNFSQDRKAAADAIGRLVELVERYRR